LIPPEAETFFKGLKALKDAPGFSSFEKYDSGLVRGQARSYRGDEYVFVGAASAANPILQPARLKPIFMRIVNSNYNPHKYPVA